MGNRAYLRNSDCPTAHTELGLIVSSRWNGWNSSYFLFSWRVKHKLPWCFGCLVWSVKCGLISNSLVSPPPLKQSQRSSADDKILQSKTFLFSNIRKVNVSWSPWSWTSSYPPPCCTFIQKSSHVSTLSSPLLSLPSLILRKKLLFASFDLAFFYPVFWRWLPKCMREEPVRWQLAELRNAVWREASSLFEKEKKNCFYSTYFLSFSSGFVPSFDSGGNKKFDLIRRERNLQHFHTIMIIFCCLCCIFNQICWWIHRWQKRGFSPFMEGLSLSGMMLATMLLTGGRKIKRKFQWNVYYLHFLFLKHEQKC